jgi:hypothetical protein
MINLTPCLLLYFVPGLQLEILPPSRPHSLLSFSHYSRCKILALRDYKVIQDKCASASAASLNAFLVFTFF